MTPSNRARCADIAASLLLACAVPAAAQPLDILRAPIEMTLTQSGIAGQTGKRWRIEPNGNWSAESVQSGAASAVQARGTLNSEELAQLRETLASQQIESLPPTIGAPRLANPQTLTIDLGGRVTTVITAGGTGLADPGSDTTSAERRAVTIARKVQDLTTK